MFASPVRGVNSTHRSTLSRGTDSGPIDHPAGWWHDGPVTDVLRPDPDLIARADRALVRTVDQLSDAQYGEDSQLPGWTRGHVVAHLALNAEGLGGALRGIATGVPTTMYASDQARDDDIAALAAEPPSTLRSRLYGAATALTDAIAALPADRLDVLVERTPGSDRTFAAGQVAAMRLREVEIHHADLGAGYTHADWPPEVAATFVFQLSGRGGATLVATDVGRTWKGDDDTPTVSGTAAALAWWLSGRGGETLTSDGELPRIEAW